MSKFLAGAVCVAILGLVNAPAVSANPLVGTGNSAAGINQTSIVQVHGCHRDVRRGGAGWHRHVGPNCRRVATGRDRPRGKRYWWKGPRCSTYCVGVGPLRVCDRDCN